MNQMKDIDQTACGNTTDSADGSHAEKELKANENVNVILNKTSH